MYDLHKTSTSKYKISIIVLVGLLDTQFSITNPISLLPQSQPPTVKGASVDKTLWCYCTTQSYTIYPSLSIRRSLIFHYWTLHPLYESAHPLGTKYSKGAQ